MATLVSVSDSVIEFPSETVTFVVNVAEIDDENGDEGVGAPCCVMLNDRVGKRV